MRYSFVYNSKLCYAPHVTEPHKIKKYLYNMGGTMGSIWPQAETNKNKKLTERRKNKRMCVTSLGRSYDKIR